MRIYTKTGDKGTTSLVYGVRVSKNDLHVEAYGTCDEANSMIGFALNHLTEEEFKEKELFFTIFHQIQTTLFHVGAELATPTGKEVKWKLTDDNIKELEKQIDEWDKQLLPLKQFVLPGGHKAASALHVARTIIRRAERCAVSIEQVNPLVLAYLNRLSDFLFVSARFVNHSFQITEPSLHEQKSH